jgi:hypothetical protein
VTAREASRTGRRRIVVVELSTQTKYQGIGWLNKVPKPKKFDQKKGVRRLARERVGTVPAPRVIEPKTRRKKPKHAKPPEAEELDA